MIGSKQTKKQTGKQNKKELRKKQTTKTDYATSKRVYV